MRPQIDDTLLRIGSANINNRSMGFDTECDLSLEAAGRGFAATAWAGPQLKVGPALANRGACFLKRQLAGRPIKFQVHLDRADDAGRQIGQMHRACEIRR